LAAAAIDELARHGVAVTLDNAGRAHFRSGRIPSRDARIMIERCADLVEAFLVEESDASPSPDGGAVVPPAGPQRGSRVVGIRSQGQRFANYGTST
jgi:hypothetical protein